LLANVSDGLAAIVIVQSAVFAEASRQLVRVLAQVELDFNSVERIVEYLEVPQEGPPITDRRPPAYWPSTEGEVHVEDLVVRYSENLPPALNHISFTVRPREKIGVVSNTHHYTFLPGSNVKPPGGTYRIWFVAFVILQTGYHNSTSLLGKSTLALSLLRMVEATEGKIWYASAPLGIDAKLMNVYPGSTESTSRPSGWRICGAKS
jgi:ABC-type multidrug transport system fused ATPase/permease subunit